MSLIACPDCGREISSLAPACIHCGRPNQQAAAPDDVAVALPECPLCGEAVTHPSARTGGSAWCERCGAKLVYGTDGALVRALPRAPEPAAQTVVIVGQRKSVGVAILLALLFGPLGMLYSTGIGALVMFFTTLFVGAVTLGMGVPFAWLACVGWAAHAATEHNRRLTYGVTLV